MQGWLLDTQLLIWLACRPDRLGVALAAELADRQRRVLYSVVSLWEVAIKASLGRPDFQLDTPALRRGLQREGFLELPIDAEHVLAVEHLPWIHRDPFDRLLVVQARHEQLNLLTADRMLCGYGDGVRWVGDGVPS
jgi:PIN domain nuclease of toxin-antitoxin system